MFLQRVFEPYRLEIIGKIIGLAAIGGLVIRPLYQVGKFFYIPGRVEQIQPTRLKISIAIVCTAILAVLFVPFPYRIFCPASIEARDAKTVFVEVPGILEQVAVHAGQQVHKGDVLAQLKNAELDVAIADLEAKRAQFESQLDSLRRERFGDTQAGLEVPHVRDSLAAVEQQLHDKHADVEHLKLVAPIDGYVIPAANLPEHKEDDDDERLPTWSGNPLEQRNLGAYLKGGVPFCQIGDPQHMQAELVIDQSDIDLVAAGKKEKASSVTVNLDELPGASFSSYVTEISPRSMHETPQELSHKSGGELQTKTTAAGAEQPLTASYQAIALDRRHQRHVDGRPPRPRQGVVEPMAQPRQPRLALVRPDIPLPDVDGSRG